MAVEIGTAGDNIVWAVVRTYVVVISEIFVALAVVGLHLPAATTYTTVPTYHCAAYTVRSSTSSTQERPSQWLV